MKKNAYLYAIMLALIITLLVSGCTKPTNPNPAPTSSLPVSSDPISTPPASSEPEPEVSSGVSSEPEPKVSSDVSSDTCSAVQPSESEFKAAFDSNPIDAAFNNEMDNAYTTLDMQEVFTKFVEIWKEEISVADKKAKKALSGDTLSEYTNNQKKWADGVEKATDKIIEDVRAECDGSAASLEIGQRSLDFYRSRVYDIYYLIYCKNNELPVLQYEGSVG